MNIEELVSIITPAFNAEKYIDQTIQSVIKQDYINWEMLIVDDYSSDNTKKIIEQYLCIDKRIKFIPLEKNNGVVYARNMAIKKAQGRYIAFLDSDDLWKSNKLSNQINFMKKNNYYFTYSNYELINDDGDKLNKIIKIPKQVNYRRMLKGNPIGCLTVIIDKTKINLIEMPKIRHEDYATWLNILKNGVIAYGLNENLAMYRKTTNSLTSNKFKSIKWTWNIYRNSQNLGLVKSIICLIMYMINSLIKYWHI